MAELVDAQDLGSCIERCGGSSPFARTNSLKMTFSFRGKFKMAVTETLSEGLKREYEVIITKKEIEKLVDQKLESIAKEANLPGLSLIHI